MKFFKNIFFFIVIYITVTPSILSQSLGRHHPIPNRHFIHYPTSEMLSNTWISDIHQCSNGFIWIATQYGLNRYDGTQFESYFYRADDTLSLSSNWIRAISEDHQGKLWLGTFGLSLDKYDPVYETFTRYHESPFDECQVQGILSIVIDSLDQLWINHKNGHEVIVYQNGSCIKQINTPNGISSVKATTRWVILHSPNSIVLLDPTSLNQVSTYQTKQSITAFLVKADTLMFAEGSMIKSLVISSDGSLTAPQTIVDCDMNIEDIAFIGDIIYLGGSTGLLAYDLTTGSSKLFSHDPERQNSIINGNILNLMVDQDDNLWIGGREGLCMMPSDYQSFEYEGVTDVLRQQERVYAILPTEDGTYLGTEDGLLYLKNDPASTPVALLSDRRVRSLILAKDGYIYIGVSSPPSHPNDPRIFQLDPSDNSILPLLLKGTVDDSLTGRVLALAEDAEGGIIATIENQLFYKARTSTSFNNVTSIVPFDFSRSGLLLNAVVDHSGTLWLGGLQSGLISIKWDGGRGSLEAADIIQYTYDRLNSNSICSNTILYLYVSSSGTLWIATDGGFNSLEPGASSFERFTRASGLASDKVLSIIEDDYGTIWMGTVSHGLLSIDSSRTWFTFHGGERGIYHDASLLKSVGKGPTGVLYFGNEGGLQIFKPIAPNIIRATLPKPRLSTLKINNEIITSTNSNILEKAPESTNSIALNHRQRNVSVSYAHPIYGSEVGYRYRLLGASDEWVAIDNLSQIAFAQLSAGRYTLEVEACKMGNCSNSEPFAIIIKPPWWNSHLAWTLYFLSLLAAIVAIVKRRERSRIKTLQLEKKAAIHQAQSRFFTNITHELRTPLTLISGPVQRLLSNNINSQSRTLLDSIKTNADQMLQLVNNLLDYSKMEAGMMPVQNRDTVIVPFVSTIIDSFRPDALSKDIDIITDLEEAQVTASLDREKVHIILSNLISNAIKYSNPSDSIYIDIVAGQSLQLSVADTGIGMTQDEVSHLFDRYYRGEQFNSIGSGVGMSLVREVVDIMKGTIQVDSNKGEGTTVNVTLPITIVEGAHSTSTIQVSAEQESRTALEQIIILLIEDHPEVANYISSGLPSQYRVIKATDGKQGIGMAIDKLPDIVITDVMMPEMDGYEVCRHLKSHDLTDHIPVVMLTARADQVSRLDGMDAGANGFLTKPFDDKELLLTLQNLLTARDSIVKKYGGAAITRPADEETSPFMRRLDERITILLEEDTLSVLSLCNSLLVSRTQLHRKIKAATGLSTTHYINKIKLSKAAVLIENTDLTISEILFSCGFNNPSYFSQLFIKSYGYSPVKYRQKKRGSL